MLVYKVSYIMYPLQLFFKFMLVLRILPICADALALNAIIYFIIKTSY